MKRKAKAILLLWTMAGLLAGCHRQDAIENTIENTDEQLTYRADDPVETEVGGNEIGNNTEPSEETEVQETEEDSAESTGIETEDAESGFYCTALTEDTKARITGSSYPDTQEPLQISYEELSYVHVLHYDFEGQIQEGELICNQAVAQDLVEIFYELYESQYPIEKIRLIDEYSADDEASMADNNTSCFNYRTVPGSTKLSNHSYGFAIDINPLYNPYVRTRPYRMRTAVRIFRIRSTGMTCVTGFLSNTDLRGAGHGTAARTTSISRNVCRNTRKFHLLN